MYTVRLLRDERLWDRYRLQASRLICSVDLTLVVWLEHQIEMQILYLYRTNVAKIGENKNILVYA